MKKGIARLGLICSLTVFTQPGFAATVSDLLITEVMVNPAALSDSQGEWFELFNPTDEQINLLGIDLGDDGSNRHRFDSDLLILPGEFLTLARGADPGFTPDYVYANFTLSNGSDEIVLREGLVELLRLDYGPGFGVAGRSRELQQLPMMASNYALTLASLGYGAGDIGTPGSGAAGLPPTVSSVPLPAAVWLFVSGLLAVLSTARQRRTFALALTDGSPIAISAPLPAVARAGFTATPSRAASMPS
jgi:hypothetical protein